MHTRALVKRAFEDAGLYRSKSTALGDLLKAIDERPEDCWPEFIELFRAKYYRLFDQIVPLLVKTGDPLILSVLVHSVDMKKRKEKTLMTQIINELDETADEKLLIQIAKANQQDCVSELKKKKALTPLVRTVIAKNELPMAPGRTALNVTTRPSARPATSRVRAEARAIANRRRT